jgi:hypothetical protein
MLVELDPLLVRHLVPRRIEELEGLWHIGPVLDLEPGRMALSELDLASIDEDHDGVVMVSMVMW